MKSNNLTMEDRLKKLYASLGLNVGAKSSNLAMIKSICAGFSIVEQNFDTVLNEIFADSSLNIGRQKMCELFDVTRFDKDVIKKFISSKYDDYRLNELKNEFQKILNSFEIGWLLWRGTPQSPAVTAQHKARPSGALKGSLAIQACKRRKNKS